MATEPTKPFYQSKSLWLNAGAAVLAAVLAFIGKLPADAAVPMWLITGANFLLRLLSDNKQLTATKK